MGFFSKLLGAQRVVKPFNTIMDLPYLEPLVVHCPPWWEEDGVVLLAGIKLCLGARNPLLALSFENFSEKTVAAIANAAFELDRKNYKIEEMADLIAVQIISYASMHGIGSLT